MPKLAVSYKNTPSDRKNNIRKLRAAAGLIGTLSYLHNKNEYVRHISDQSWLAELESKLEESETVIGTLSEFTVVPSITKIQELATKKPAPRAPPRKTLRAVVPKISKNGELHEPVKDILKQ
jgi:hypothetical protein